MSEQGRNQGLVVGSISPVSIPRDVPQEFGSDQQYITTFKIPLDVALTEKEFPCNAATFFWVQTGTSAGATVKVRFNRQDSGQLTLTRGVAMSGLKFSRIFVTNDPQPGESVTIVCIREAEGLLRVLNASVDAASVVIQKATVLNSVVDVSIGAGVAAQVLPANANRRIAILQNPLINAMVFRVGDSPITATRGIDLQPGERIEIETTEAIFAFNPDSVARSMSAIWTED